MTTHDGHDHPNTKAARASCRRSLAASIDHHPAGRAMSASQREATKPERRLKSVKIERPTTDPGLPHEYDEDAMRPGRCFVCQLTQRARVHTDGPSDLSARFQF